MPNPERLFARSHLGFCQDAFSYLKTRCCLFCWCASYIWSCFFYLYLFAELLSEWRDDVRAEKLLSSAAKIVFLIIHQLRLYTGLMANSTSYLLLVNSISKEMLSLQTQGPLAFIRAWLTCQSCTDKSFASPSWRNYTLIGLVESSACASTWPLHHFLEGQLSIGILCYWYVFVSFSGTEYSVRFYHQYT